MPARKPEQPVCAVVTVQPSIDPRRRRRLAEIANDILDNAATPGEKRKP